MKVIRLFAICLTVVFLVSGCVVTKKSYTSLLSELTALDLEKQEVEEDLSDTRAKNDKTIAKQKNRISSMEQEITDIKTKYDDDMAIAASRREELSKSLEGLQAKSSEQTQNLLKQVDKIQKKYETDISAKNKAIDTLKAEHRQKTERLNNRFDQAAQSNRLTVERLLKEIDTLEALTAEQKNALNELSDQADQIEHQLKDEIEKGEIRLKRYKTKTIINIDNSILFGSGKAILKEGIRKPLTKIAKAMGNFPENNIQIEGHTDNVPIKTSKFPSNWELSSARALSVLRFFANEANLDPRKLSAVGYGEFHPLAPNDTPENRRLNRRVDIVILPAQ